MQVGREHLAAGRRPILLVFSALINQMGTELYLRTKENSTLNSLAGRTNDTRNIKFLLLVANVACLHHKFIQPMFMDDGAGVSVQWHRMQRLRKI